MRQLQTKQSGLQLSLSCKNQILPIFSDLEESAWVKGVFIWTRFWRIKGKPEWSPETMASSSWPLSLSTISGLKSPVLLFGFFFLSLSFAMALSMLSYCFCKQPIVVVPIAWKVNQAAVPPSLIPKHNYIMAIKFLKSWSRMEMKFKARGRTVVYAGWGGMRCGVESGSQVPAVLRDREHLSSGLVSLRTGTLIQCSWISFRDKDVVTQSLLPWVPGWFTPRWFCLFFIHFSSVSVVTP